MLTKWNFNCCKNVVNYLNEFIPVDEMVMKGSVLNVCQVDSYELRKLLEYCNHCSSENMSW